MQYKSDSVGDIIFFLIIPNNPQHSPPSPTTTFIPHAPVLRGRSPFIDYKLRCIFINNGWFSMLLGTG